MIQVPNLGLNVIYYSFYRGTMLVGNYISHLSLYNTVIIDDIS